MVALNFILIVVCLIFFPPAAIMLHDKTLCNRNIVICLILTILGWIPGLIFAIFVLFFKSAKVGI